MMKNVEQNFLFDVIWINKIIRIAIKYNKVEERNAYK